MQYVSLGPDLRKGQREGSESWESPGDIYTLWSLQSQAILLFNYGLNDKELSTFFIMQVTKPSSVAPPPFYSPGQLLFFPLSVGAASPEGGHQPQASKRPGAAATSHPAFVGLSLCLCGTGEGSGSEGTKSIGKLTPSPMPRTLVFGH